MHDFMGTLEHNALNILIIIVVGTFFYIVGSMVVTWLTSLIIHHAYHRNMHKKDLEKRINTLKVLFANIWRVFVVLITFYAIVRIFFSSAELAPLFASASVIGIALGFGTQTIVKDFLSGLFIISDNQYRVGDVIEIDGAGGTVERIGARSTVIRDVEGNVHFFPNGMIQHVINKTMDYSMARVVLAVEPDTNIDDAAKLINAIGQSMMEEPEWKDRILTAPSYVMLGDISATAANLIVSGKVPPSDQWAVSAELRRRILRAFEEHGIELGINTTSTSITSSKGRKK